MNIINRHAGLLIAFVGIATMLASCSKYREIAPSNYPDQTIYMPAANSGYYQINSISQPIGNVPTPGQPYRYVVDVTNNKFVIPLAVYRAGVNNDGDFKVNIALATDTISKLINTGKLVNTDILPSGQYSIPSFVNMLNGKELASFDLSINLDSLRNSYGKMFAFAINISSTERKSNPALSTVIVVIDTKFMKPTANFTSKADASDLKKINFTNTSLSSVGYSWSFGDGSTAVMDKSPSHSFSAPGTYTVTLTATGITGDKDKSTKSAKVVIQ